MAATASQIGYASSVVVIIASYFFDNTGVLRSPSSLNIIISFCFLFSLWFYRRERTYLVRSNQDASDHSQTHETQPLLIPDLQFESNETNDDDTVEF